MLFIGRQHRCRVRVVPSEQAGEAPFSSACLLPDRSYIAGLTDPGMRSTACQVPFDGEAELYIMMGGRSLSIGETTKGVKFR